jgi:hypothetical protein
LAGFKALRECHKPIVLAFNGVTAGNPSDFPIAFGGDAEVFPDCYQSFNLASSGHHVGRIALRDQLDWTGAAWVLTATDFRRSK